MARTFFRELSSLENEVILTGSHNVDGSLVAYKEFTKDVLSKVIRFVECGDYFNSKVAKVICANFRLKNSEMLNIWHASGHGSNDSAFRTYVSIYSSRLYDLFGKNFYEVVVTEDMQRLTHINNTLKALEIDDWCFDDIFIPLVSASVPRGTPLKVFKLEDCKAELQILKRLTKRYVNDLIDTLDVDKLAYLKHTFNKFTINSKKINKDKIELLEFFDLLDDNELSEISSINTIMSSILEYADKPPTSNITNNHAYVTMVYVIRILSNTMREKALKKFNPLDVKKAIDTCKDDINN